MKIRVAFLFALSTAWVILIEMICEKTNTQSLLEALVENQPQPESAQHPEKTENLEADRNAERIARRKASQERYVRNRPELVSAKSKRWKEKLKATQPDRYAARVLEKADYDLKYRAENREKRRLYKADAERKKKWNAIRNARYRATHNPPVWQTPEQRLELRRARGRENQKKWKQKNNDRQRNRRRNEPTYRLINNLRRRVYDMLTRGNKSAHTMELIGCTTEHLKAHLESQFTQGMTWGKIRSRRVARRP